MSSLFAGRVAIVTGASRGIGRELALALGRAGCRVVVAAKSVTPTPELPGTIHTVAQEIVEAGGEALPVRVDVRDHAQIESMVAAAVSKWNRVDILINNAGALWWKSVEETPIERYDLINGINARATFAASRAVLPIMRRQGHGHIIMQSPPIELDNLKNKTAYSISKFGMTLCALGIAQEMKGVGVAANSIWPKTLIESQATINHRIGNPALWRKPAILVDAIMGVLGEDPHTFTGHQLIDEDYMRSRGVTDFAKYRCDPQSEPPSIQQLDHLMNAGKPAQRNK